MKKILGKKIKDLRKTKGFTQEEFAGLIGVTFQAVSKWERGESYPDINYLPAISKILNISIDELLGNTSDCSENEIKHYLELYDEYTFENQKTVYSEFDKAAKLYPNDFRIQIRYMDLINKICAKISAEEYENKDFDNFDKESKRIEYLYYFINNNCTDDSIRIWAKRIMCNHLMYRYDCRGFDKNNLIEYENIMNTLPSLYESREYVSLMKKDISKWFLIRENVINELLFMLLRVVVSYCYYTDDKFSVDYRIKVIENINSLLEVFSEKFSLDKNTVQYIYNLGHLSNLYYRINNNDKVFECLEKGVDEAIKFDKQDNAKLLLKHYESDNTMSMSERIKLLMTEYYGFSDELKNDKRFIKLIEKLV